MNTSCALVAVGKTIAIMAMIINFLVFMMIFLICLYSLCLMQIYGYGLFFSALLVADAGLYMVAVPPDSGLP